MKSAGTAVVSGEKSDVVLLTPRSSSAPFTRAKVWVGAATDVIQQFEIVDANGLTRFVVITRLIPNVPIARSAFSFTPPRNARILDSASFGGM